MLDDQDLELRETALRLACESEHGIARSTMLPPEAVVERARAYYTFLKGDAEKAEADNG